MSLHSYVCACCFPICLVLALLAGSLPSQSAQAAPPGDPPKTAARPSPTGDAVPGEHPLAPAMKTTREALELLDREYRDYSATMVKRERIDGKLSDYEYIYVKIRHKPFSVYTHFLKPESQKGQEAIYVAGRNDGKLQAHGVGMQSLIGTVSLDPNGSMAMKGQRYPITQAGIRNLMLKILEIGQREMEFGECEVKFFQGAKVEGRTCTLVELHHPKRRKEFAYALARVYVDDEYKAPVRFEGYEWGKKPGDAPVLIEEYTYTKLQFNRGFTDADFDTRNKSYKFE